MTHIHFSILNIPVVNALIGLALLYTIFRIISIIRLFRFKSRVEKEMRIASEANERVLRMVDEININPDAYTVDQRLKCIEVLIGNLPAIEQEEQFKKILQIA